MDYGKLGVRVRQQRELSGLTQGQLAKQVGCSLPPIETRVEMTCEGKNKTGYVNEGYAFSPVFKLGYTAALTAKEGVTTWLRLKKES